MFRKKLSESNKISPNAPVAASDMKSTDIPSSNGSRMVKLVMAATFFDNAIVPIDIVPSEKQAQEKQTRSNGFGN